MISNLELMDMIEDEGVEYTVLYKINTNNIEDTLARELVNLTCISITKLTDYLEAATGRELYA